MQTKVTAIALAVLGAVFALLVTTVAGPCVHDDGSTGMCAASGNALLAMGAAVVVVALVRAFIPGKAPALVLDVVAALAGLAIVFVPGNVTPLCMMETMHCNAVMHPTAMVCGALIAIVAAVDAVRTARA